MKKATQTRSAPLTFSSQAAVQSWLSNAGLPGWPYLSGSVWWACYATERGVLSYVDQAGTTVRVSKGKSWQVA